jgi:hypothetical protein
LFMLIGKTERVDLCTIEQLIKGKTVATAEFVESQGGLDVLEAEDRTVIIPPHRKGWTYGTVGQGVDILRLAWPKETHIFSCQTKNFRPSLPGRPLVELELGPPKKVRAHVLNLYPVDFLFIDGEDPSVWSPWLSKAKAINRPRAFVWMGAENLLEDDTQGPGAKHVRKALERAGYRLQFCFLSAEKLGSGVAQDRLVLIGTQPSHNWVPVECTEDLGLPRRSMSNLLMPVGVPRKAWHSGLVSVTSRAKRWWPCEVNNESEDEPIFERTGLMPDRPHSLIRSERGIRRLQLQELAKGKGVPSDWIAGNGSSEPLKEYGVKHSSCLHLWTTVMDAIAVWQRKMTEAPRPMLPLAGTLLSPKIRSVEALPVEELGAAWTWDVPDLHEGSPWYLARIDSLRKAVADLPDGDIHFVNGLAALQVHRTNYSEDGPKRLQILWWEFPLEHWEALREGSRMNFLTTPQGELKLNAAMDEVSIVAAGKFVDELKLLGVLLPATDGLRANCPLFCVDKPGQPGKKRCIADMKTGGQN